LSPQLVEAIVQGRRRFEFTATRLTELHLWRCSTLGKISRRAAT
jgi:hypothetical protein